MKCVAMQVFSVSHGLIPREEEPRLSGQMAQSQRSRGAGALSFLHLPGIKSSRAGGAKDTVLGFKRRNPDKPDLILLGTRKLFQVDIPKALRPQGGLYTHPVPLGSRAGTCTGAICLMHMPLPSGCRPTWVVRSNSDQDPERRL